MNFNGEIPPFNLHLYDDYSLALDPNNLGSIDHTPFPFSPVEEKSWDSYEPNQDNYDEGLLIGNYVGSHSYYLQNHAPFYPDPVSRVFSSEPFYENTFSSLIYKPDSTLETSPQAPRLAEPLNKKRFFSALETQDFKVKSRKRARTEGPTDSEDLISTIQIRLNSIESQKKTAISADRVKAQYLERTMEEISKKLVTRTGSSRDKEITNSYIRMLDALYEDKTGEVFKGESEYRKITNLFSSRKRRLAEKKKQIELNERLIELENKNNQLLEENKRLKIKIQELSKGIL